MAILTANAIEPAPIPRWERGPAEVVPIGTSSRLLRAARIGTGPGLDPERLSRELAGADATGVIEWAARTFGEGLAMSTSFGIGSAAFLHLVTTMVPGIPVIWVDTGYLPRLPAP